ncbi:hypothetical protein FKP32DRAFT_227499 [Trametes sanguinea]|nr:hypothetical protein FKP32DRAFT_227499 [Trametes sanguinea]
MMPVPTSPAFYQWSLVARAATSGRAFTRPLSVAEMGFYYDRVFNGTADMVWRYTVEVTKDGATNAGQMFCEQNVERAWATLKQYYPLLGCRAAETGDSNIAFLVDERDLSHHRPGEVVLGSILTQEERDTILFRLTRDAPTEDHHVVGRVIVLKRDDKPGTYELIFKLAHFVGDGASGMNLARTFLDVLSSPPLSVLPPLEERLAMALPWEALNPTLKMSVPRQRWRRAIGQVTFLNMRRRLSGGHAMPRSITDLTYYTPAVTQRVAIRFDPSQSRTIIAAARRHGVTLGAAMPVISQMALARVLHRRYLRGDMSEEEWERRRRQPMHYGGPLNLRPHLDKEWLRQGGLSGIALMIDFYDCTLPFMPTPFGTRRDADVPRVDGAPPFSALLSRERFIHRVKGVKRQISRGVKHPLFLDIAHARQQRLSIRKKAVAEHWLAAVGGRPPPQSTEPRDLDPVAPDFVFTGGLSSIGDVSQSALERVRPLTPIQMAQALLPTAYPLPSSHPLSISRKYVRERDVDPIGNPSLAAHAANQLISSNPSKDVALRIVDGGTYLHSTPTDFFLGNGTTRNHFELLLSYDANVYRREDAEEYLRECGEATLYYFSDQPADATAKGKL